MSGRTGGDEETKRPADEIKTEYTEQELLDTKPAKGASPAEWQAWHQMLYDAGLLRPPEPAK